MLSTSAVQFIQQFGNSKGFAGYLGGQWFLFDTSECAIKAGCSVVVYVFGNICSFVYIA
jgi:hypothetical protein